MTDFSADAARSAVLGRRRRATRAALVAAAQDVFDEVGYEAATVADIVARAASSRATFYLYFSGKQEAYWATAEHLAADLADEFARLDSIIRDADGEAFGSWLGQRVDWARRNQRLFLVWREAEHADAGTGSQAWRSTVEEWLECMPWFARQWGPDSIEPRTRLGLFISQIQFFHLDLLSDAETDHAVALLTTSWLGQLRRTT